MGGLNALWSSRGTRAARRSPVDSPRNTRLPLQTQWIEIAGGNHAQFGYYGRQLQDCAATIRRDEQQRQLQQSLLAFLEHIRSCGTSHS